MELYVPGDQAEEYLGIKADLLRIPLGGVMELLPLCNMDCRMCYVRLSKAEMDAQGVMLSCDEWLRIADEAVKAGTLYLTLTGGEPLLYPDFKRLYAALRAKGLILRVNTNGTMIDEAWADFFAEHGCREISISLYGPDDSVYGDLCRNPKGFSQVMRAAKLLKERNVCFRFTCSMTPYNVQHLTEIHAIAKEIGVPLEVANYMFPAMRRGEEGIRIQQRLEPERAAKVYLDNFVLEHPEVSLAQAAKDTLTLIKQAPKLRKSQTCFVCHAGYSGYWMNWKGEMLPCGMFNEPAISLKKHSFKECWDYIVHACAALPKCSTCANCPVQNICHPCPAVNYTETGRTDGWPEYKCRMTRELVQLCMEYIKKDSE